MAYSINKTDGSLYATVADGTIDTTTSLTLVGKNYTGYGEIQNENYFRLLESHANTSAPGNPQKGQLWFDTTNSVLNVFKDSTTSKPLAVQATSLTEPAAIDSEVGDTWYNTTTHQLTVYDGSTYTTVGPLYSSTEGETGAIVATVTDDIAADHVVTMFMNSDEIVAIVSKDALFTPDPVIGGFTTVGPGITLSTLVAGTQFVGSATNALSLNGSTAADFLSAVADDSTTGTLDIVNDIGLTIGLSNDTRIAVTSGIHTLIANDSGGDINIATTGGTGLTIDAVSGNARVGSPNNGLDAVNQSYVTAAINTGLTTAIVAADIPLVDAGTYYTTDEVESAFQEVGADLLLKGNIDGQTFTNTILTSPVLNTGVSGTAIDTTVTTSTTKIPHSNAVKTAIETGVVHPAFRAYVAGSYTTGIGAVVTFDTETFDATADYNTSTYTFTPSTAGLYSVTASIRITGATSTGVVGDLLIRKNAGIIARAGEFHTVNTDDASYVITTLVEMNGTTDNLDVYAGGATGIAGGTTLTYFQAHRVQPL